MCPLSKKVENQRGKQQRLEKDQQFHQMGVLDPLTCIAIYSSLIQLYLVQI